LAKLKFTLYKHIKIDGASNNKVKPHLVVIDGEEQKHEGGSYCVRHKNTWIDVGKRSSGSPAPTYEAGGRG
jgi:hypothetical protein